MLCETSNTMPSALRPVCETRSGPASAAMISITITARTTNSNLLRSPVIGCDDADSIHKSAASAGMIRSKSLGDSQSTDYTRVIGEASRRLPCISIRVIYEISESVGAPQRRQHRVDIFDGIVAMHGKADAADLMHDMNVLRQQGVMNGLRVGVGESDDPA